MVDHDYNNSYDYTKKRVSLSGVMYANRMLRRGILRRRRTCDVLDKRDGKDKIKVFDCIGAERFRRNREMACRNIDELERMLVSDIPGLKERLQTVIEYVQSLKKLNRTVAGTQLLKSNPEMQTKALMLSSCYTNIQSLFWKLQKEGTYEYVGRKIEQILRKLEEIKALERDLYDFLAEASK